MIIIIIITSDTAKRKLITILHYIKLRVQILIYFNLIRG